MASSDGYPWDSDDDQLAYTRVFLPTRDEELRMLAVRQAATATSAQIRRSMMRMLPLPPRYGYPDRGTDILTCWQGQPVVPVRSIMDYTDDEAGLQASSRPSLGHW